ncbi:hypothetical protein LCGC14_0411950 [marine sediment metagenome]|uniref:Uncharacterized protein n=1 Tax=marine sediment metagenome TaxID=412755 RepID=A0A0F9W2V2_9ZZZZ
MDIELDYKTEVSGRCHRCNIRYIWKKNHPKLKDAIYPNCGMEQLHQTIRLFKGKSIRVNGGLPTQRRKG